MFLFDSLYGGAPLKPFGNGFMLVMDGEADACVVGRKENNLVCNGATSRRRAPMGS